MPPTAPSRQKGKKHNKSHKNYSHKKYKKYKDNIVKPNDFYAKKKNVSKKYDKQMSGKSKCFNCGKPGMHCLESLNQTIRLILWKIIFLFHLILVTNLLMILLVPLILKLAVEILVVMLLTLLILSLKAKKMKN